MSFTDQSQAFVGIHETGLNILLKAIMKARPYLFCYGTKEYRDSNPSASISLINDIQILGTPITFPILILIPFLKIDCFPHTPNSESIYPAELEPLKENEFSLEVHILLRSQCIKVQASDLVLTHRDSKEINAEIILWAVGSPITTTSGTMTEFSLTVRSLEIVEIAPAEIEDILECLLQSILNQAVLPRIKVALDAISLNLFSIKPSGLFSHGDMICAYGDII